MADMNATHSMTPTPSTRSSSIDQLMAMINGNQPTMGDNIADLGSAIGAFGQGEKANRLSGADLTQNFDQMMINRENSINRMGIDAQTGRNQNEADALQKLQQTAYLGGGGNSFNAPSLSLGGRTIQTPDLGFGPKAATPEEMSGANALQGQLASRLGLGGSFTPSNTYQPTPLESYAKPGLGEKISSGLGAGAGILGMLGNVFGPGAEGEPGLLSKIPGLSKLGSFLGGSGATSNAATGSSAAGLAPVGFASNVLGKAIPIAGAITGGAGLIKDQGLGKNIMNGVGAGASIGSMVPGLGTAVGAGIGAGVGALRSVFGNGPSEQELAGRDVASQARQSIASGATPGQMAEAKSSGWEKPEDALTLIVLRDKLMKQGGTPEQANQLASSLWHAEKGGPQAVEQAVTNIMKALGHA